MVQEIEDDRTLFDCDLCSIQVSSKANLKLHDSLPMHQKSLEKSTDREMGENREKNLKKLKINLGTRNQKKEQTEKQPNDEFKDG